MALSEESIVKYSPEIFNDIFVFNQTVTLKHFNYHIQLDDSN